MRRDTTEDELYDALHNAFMAYWRSAHTCDANMLWLAYCAAQARYDDYLVAKLTSEVATGLVLKASRAVDISLSFRLSCGGRQAGHTTRQEKSERRASGLYRCPPCIPSGHPYQPDHTSLTKPVGLSRPHQAFPRALFQVIRAV
jgi:hypothetical protein